MNESKSGLVLGIVGVLLVTVICTCATRGGHKSTPRPDISVSTGVSK